LIEQRDQEIELVIQRLESESGSNNSDAARKYRIDVERIKAETAEEMKQLRDQHSMALDKLLTAQSQIQSLENSQRTIQKEKLQLEHQLVTKDTLLKKQKQELTRLQADESELIQQIRLEFDKEIMENHVKIQKLEQMISNQERILNSENKRHQEQLESLKIENNHLIEQVETKVTEALETKDQVILQLHQQLDESTMRVHNLESLIDKQRQVTFISRRNF
jgi:hypothetical protein